MIKDPMGDIFYTLNDDISQCLIKKEYTKLAEDWLQRAIKNGHIVYNLEMYLFAVIHEISEWGKGVSVKEIQEYTGRIFSDSEIMIGIRHANRYYMFDRSFKVEKRDGREWTVPCWYLCESTYFPDTFHPHSKQMRVATFDGKSVLREPLSINNKGERTQ